MQQKSDEKTWICLKLNGESMQFHEKALKTHMKDSIIKIFHSIEEKKSQIQLFCHEIRLNFQKSLKAGKIHGGV